MISDALSEAHDLLRRYLDDPNFDAVYAGARRARIESLMTEMDAVRVELDRPPR